MTTDTPHQTNRILPYKLQIIIFIGISLLLTSIAFLFVNNAEQEKLKNSFKEAASAYQAQLNTKLQQNIHETKSIRHFFSASNHVTRQEFSAFVSPILADNPEIQALQWVPRVTTTDIQRYIDAARQDNLNNFNIRDEHRDNKGDINEYFPLYYVEPVPQNSDGLGFNLATDTKIKHSMDRARDCNCAISTPLLTRSQSVDKNNTFLIIVPVYRNRTKFVNIADRRHNLQGFSVGVFIINKILTAETNLLNDNGILVDIIDKENTQSNQQPYLHTPKGKGKGKGKGKKRYTSVNTYLQHEISFDVAGRQWILNFTATPTYQKLNQQSYSWIVLIIGLILTSGLLIFLITNQRHQLATEKLSRNLAIAKEAADKSSKAKSAFLSSMTHELRTPLSTILGFGQLLKADKALLNDEQLENIDYILNGGNQLLGLVNQVLDLSKVESNTINITLETTEINHILEHCFSVVRTLSSENEISIDESILNTTLPAVKIDVDRFKQIIINLLSNAIKYNRKNGSVYLNHEIQKYKGMLRLSISDTGHGIKKEKREKLFTPFNRLGAESLDIDGVGIGLTISKAFIELMNGHIGYSPAVDQGSIFWIEVQLAN